MSKTLYEHAQYELKKLGLLQDGEHDSRTIVVNTLALIKHIEKMKLNEHTHKWVLEFTETLANHLPLSPITDQPDEWEAFEDSHKNLDTGVIEVTKRWQNKRAPMVISLDGGKTFMDMRTNKEGVSVDHIVQNKEWEDARKAREAAKEAEETQKKNAETARNVVAAAPADTSTPAGEDAPAPAPKSAAPAKPKADEKPAETAPGEEAK